MQVGSNSPSSHLSPTSAGTIGVYCKYPKLTGLKQNKLLRGQKSETGLTWAQAVQTAFLLEAVGDPLSSLFQLLEPVPTLLAHGP